MSQFVHLTQVTTIYSMPADGGLPSNTGGVRGALPLGTGLPGISVPAPLAGGLPLPALRCRQGLAPAVRSVAVRGLRPPSFGDGRNDLPGHAHSAHVWFRAMWWVTTQENGVSALGLQRVLGLGSYQTAWAWLHKTVPRDGEAGPGSLGRSRRRGRNLSGWFGRGQAGSTDGEEGLDRGGRTRRGPEYRPRPYAASRPCLGGELDAVCARLRRTGQHGAYGRVAGLRTPGKERLPPPDYFPSGPSEVSV